MSTVLTPPAPAAAPSHGPLSAGYQPLLWTVAEFHQINSTGIWEGRRPILLHGVILELGPMNPPHANCVDLAAELLRPIFGTGWRMRVQSPLVLGLDIDPMPDIAVVSGGPRDFMQAHPTSASLVVEISDTTLQLDLTKKAEDYATAGIPEYWVLDLNGRQLHVLRDPGPLPPGGHAYRHQRVLAAGDAVSPLAAPAASVAVADLLP